MESRKIIRFMDEEDKYDPFGYADYIELYFNKDKLLNFIKISKDIIYGLTTEFQNDKGLKYILSALDLFLELKDSKESRTFPKYQEYYYEEITEWIADYSGAIRVVYDDEPDVEWEGTKRPQIVGITAVPKKFFIINIQEIERLRSELREILVSHERKRIKLFLKDNPDLGWRCANCGHFLGINLDKEKILTDYLADFFIRRFRVCHKCRARNLFILESSGQIKFTTTKRRLFGEKKSLPKSCKIKIQRAKI
jgi:hypothetical protein